MKNRQPSLMVHTNPEFENFEFDQHLGSHKHVINIIMWFRDMECYNTGWESPAAEKGEAHSQARERATVMTMLGEGVGGRAVVVGGCGADGSHPASSINVKYLRF
jgi:hypothetical protein